MDSKHYKGFKDLFIDIIGPLDIQTLKVGDIVEIVGVNALTTNLGTHGKVEDAWTHWGERAAGRIGMIVKFGVNRGDRFAELVPHDDRGRLRPSGYYCCWFRLVKKAEDA